MPCRITLLCLMTLFSSSLLADTRTFVREYTYVASDLDSKVSARNNALKLIKAGVLEEIVSYTHNTSVLEQAQSGKNFTKSFIQTASTMSAGFVQARILDEKWDGFSIWLKAEIKADPVKVRQQLDAALAAQNTVPADNTLKPDPQADQPLHQPVAMVAPVVAPANINADYSGYMKAARLTQVLTLLAPIKMRMREHMAIYGEWPHNLRQINLDSDEMSDGENIDAVKIGRDGAIIVSLNKQHFGNGKLLAYTPRSIMGGMNTRWQCTTNLPVTQYGVTAASICKQDNSLQD